MRTLARIMVAFALLGILPAHAITAFQHIVIVFQENRSPDNLFYQLCQQTLPACSTTDPAKFDIQTLNWLDKNASGGTINPLGTPLETCDVNGNNCWDPGHSHTSWLDGCDPIYGTNGLIVGCKMDGAASEPCGGAGCGALAQFPYYYVNSDITSYLVLAKSYGWANHMEQTNEGPSFPAHQFIFGASSAPSQGDDAAGTFVSENLGTSPNGCLAPVHAKIQLIDAFGIEDPNNTIYPCLEHQTISDLLETYATPVSWKYYTPGDGSLWTAPDAIEHICGGIFPNGDCATGSDFKRHVDTTPSDVLCNASLAALAAGCSSTNLQQRPCSLAAVSWVIPDGSNSDHPGNNPGGPDWVASIVNAIGQSGCKDNGVPYWQDTAIVITWDDWGGWYDHENPVILAIRKGVISSASACL
jgi:phospholipase C